MPEIKMFYLRDKHGFPVACVASTKETEDTVKYTVSTHNPMDRYDKKTARHIALGRLTKFNPLRSTSELSPLGGIVSMGGAIRKDIVQDIINGPFPQRARDAAKYMMKTVFYSE